MKNLLYSLKGNSFPRSCSKVSGISSSKEALLFVSVFISVCSLSCCSILIHPPTYLDTSRQQKKKKNYTSSGDLWSRLSEKTTFFCNPFLFLCLLQSFSPFHSKSVPSLSIIYYLDSDTGRCWSPTRTPQCSLPCKQEAEGYFLARTFLQRSQPASSSWVDSKVLSLGSALRESAPELSSAGEPRIRNRPGGERRTSAAVR